MEISGAFLFELRGAMIAVEDKLISGNHFNASASRWNNISFYQFGLLKA
jgi:hypothetical protein